MTGSVTGFVGPGRLGMVMATRLLAAGHRVRVYARRPDVADELAGRGAEIAASPRDLAAKVDIVLGCLANTAAVRAVYQGPDGLLAGAYPGLVLVEHATFAPDLAEALAVEAAAGGAHFVDAPFTGGPEGAERGDLVVMAGGADEAVAAAAPVLRVYSGDVVHVGGPGGGLRLKLLNQCLTICNVVAAAETVAIAMRLGMPQEATRRVLTAGWGASTMLERVLDRSYRQDYSSPATIAGLAELRELVLSTAGTARIEAGLIPAATEMVWRAAEQGAGEFDVSYLTQFYLDAGVSSGDPRPDPGDLSARNLTHPTEEH